MRLRHWLMATLIFPVLLAAPASAQHIADQGILRGVVTETQATDAANRAIVLQALEHPDFRAAADRFGLDLTEAASAVERMRGAELEELAAPARSIAAAQGGGNTTIVISVTTLLLLLILLVLILK